MFRPNRLERMLLELLKGLGVSGAGEIKGFFYNLHAENPLLLSGKTVFSLSLGDLLKACSHTILPDRPPYRRLFLGDQQIQTLDVGDTYLFVDCAFFALLFSAARQLGASGGVVNFTFPLMCMPIIKMKTGPPKGGSTLLCLQRPARPDQHANNWMARHPDGDFMWLGRDGLMKMPLADAVRRWGSNVSICKPVAVSVGRDHKVAL